MCPASESESASAVDRISGVTEVANETVACPQISWHSRARPETGKVRRADIESKHEPALLCLQGCPQPNAESGQELGRFAKPLRNVSERALLRVPFAGRSRMATGTGRKPDCLAILLSLLREQSSAQSRREIIAPINGVATKERPTQIPREMRIVICCSPAGESPKLDSVLA